MSVPVFTIQDPLAAAGAVVLDCRPPLLPASTCMYISGVDRQVGFRRCRLVWMDFSPDVSRYPRGGGDLLGLICPELGVAPLVDPGTDLEDERHQLVPRWRPWTSACLFIRVGRGRGSGTCSLGGGGLAGDGDAHFRPCFWVFHVPSDISCAPGPHDVDRELDSAGGGSSCWPGSGESVRSEIPLRRVASPASVV